jgi:YVTN family beta-propeller protein
VKTNHKALESSCRNVGVALYMRFSNWIMCFFIALTLLSGCGPDCQGLRGTIKNGLGGECTKTLESVTPSQVTVTGAATYVASGGSSVQFTAATDFSNGETEDTTSEVTWSLTNPTVGSIDNDGLFTSSATGGITDVIATYEGVTSSASLKVTGFVTDITVGTNPMAAVVRPNSDEVWVTNSDRTISIINTLTNTVTQTIPDLGGAKSPAFMTFLPDGSKAYVSTGAGNTVEVINASTKVVGAPIAVTGADQIMVAPDGVTVFVKGSTSIQQINSVTDVASAYASGGACFVHGFTILQAGLQQGHLYRSEQCHGGGDWLFDYPSFTSSLGSTNFPLAGWVAGRLFSSPDGTRVFAAVGNITVADRVLQTSDNSILETTTGFWGSWSFVPDRPWGIMGRVVVSGAVQDYAIYDYSGATLTLLDVVSVAPFSGAMVAATLNRTLYLPQNASNTIKVYQYRD